MKKLVQLILILLFLIVSFKAAYSCDDPSCMEMPIMMPDGAGEWMPAAQALKLQQPLATTTFTPVPTTSPVAASTPVPEQSPALGVAKNFMEYARDGLEKGWQWLSDGVGKLKDKAADTLIKGLASNIPGVAQASEWALVRMGESAVKPLIESYAYIEEAYFQRVTLTLAKVGKPTVTYLIDALGNVNLYIRKGAAIALGEIGDLRAIEPLSGVLAKDKDPGVRMNAALGLVRIGDPRIVKPLMKALREDSFAGVRINASGGLSRIGDLAAFEVLAEALETDTEPLVRRNSAVGLGRIGNLRAVELLKRAAIRDPDPRVQQAARQALNELEKIFNRIF